MYVHFYGFISRIGTYTVSNVCNRLLHARYLRAMDIRCNTYRESDCIADDYIIHEILIHEVIELLLYTLYVKK